MRNIIIFAALCAAVRASAAPAATPETLLVRCVAWDYSWKPISDEQLGARVVSEIAAAAKAGVDVVVFPERFSGGRPLEGLLAAAKAAAGQDRLVVLGNAPSQGRDGSVSRAYVLSGDAWQAVDKLDPTPAERAQTPPVLPGQRLPLFRFRGGIVAALPANSIAKSEVAAVLKKRAIQLVLVSAPAEDEAGFARLSRTASARAVELGAAIVTAPPAAAAPELYLPAQTGFELKAPEPVGRDFRLPWKKLLELRAPPKDLRESRPFAEPTVIYQVEL